MKILEKAMNFAKQKHTGQKRDGGGDYFTEHILIVVQCLNHILRHEDNNLLAAAFLHDTIEDTDTTYEELVKEFNQDIADLVMEVTHEGKKDETGYYFPRLHTKRAIMLKFADRLANLSDMDSWDEKRQQHYLKKSKFWKDTL